MNTKQGKPTKLHSQPVIVRIVEVEPPKHLVVRCIGETADGLLLRITERPATTSDTSGEVARRRSSNRVIWQLQLNSLARINIFSNENPNWHGSAAPWWRWPIYRKLCTAF